MRTITTARILNMSGLTVEEVYEQAEAMGVEGMTEDRVYAIANALFDDKELSDARQQALSRAIEFTEE